MKVWVWISGGICQLLPNGWQGWTKKSKPVCRLKLCTQRSTVMTENLSIVKAANICCVLIATPKKTPKGLLITFMMLAFNSASTISHTYPFLYTKSTIGGICRGLR